MIGGGGFTLLTLWMRHRFIWWPFHPIGYLLNVSAVSFMVVSLHRLAAQIRCAKVQRRARIP
jgi:hypothetical protein